ncbi:MAG: D-Ala-D-Ala carboxypeptidase family metallohydrolase [Bacteroidales bacterium]
MKYFTVKELCKTSTGSENVPNKGQEANLVFLIENVLDPVREKLRQPIYVTSGFRSQAVNKKVGGVWNSQHCVGQAADITLKNKAENTKLFQLINEMCIKGQIEFDQLIWEKGTKAFPQWIHVSYKAVGTNRKQVLYLR